MVVVDGALRALTVGALAGGRLVVPFLGGVMGDLSFN